MSLLMFLKLARTHKHTLKGRGRFHRPDGLCFLSTVVNKR